MLMGAVVSIFWLMRVTLEQKRAPMRYWVWAGIGLAIALMSKYQAALIPISVFVFMLTTRQGRTWFLQPGPYIAALIGLVGLAPVIIWNLSNDWASFAFHTSRAGEGLKPLRFAVMIGGQALFLLPPLLLLAIWRLWHAFVDRPGRSVELLLALVALGPIILFHYIYMTSSQSLAHWTMPGWIFAVPLGRLLGGARQHPSAATAGLDNDGIRHSGVCLCRGGDAARQYRHFDAQR